MEIYAQFDQPVCVHTGELAWQASPMAGVDRRMLDRVGDEVARATSLVRYAPRSKFAEHTHSGGEEFIVLEGVFQDEHADYPAGTYIRNPIGTRHIPRSEAGCIIFVKLWQFAPHDQEQIAINLNSAALEPDPAMPGISRAVLASREYEMTALEEWDAGTRASLCDKGGFEILILVGELRGEGGIYARHDWIRWPAGDTAQFTAGAAGARIWIKRGHLSEIRIPPQK